MVKHIDIKPVDLRGILKYVPLFRNHIFVIAIDGSIIEDENFQNVVTDLAVLRSLSIKIVLIHGIGAQIRQLAEDRKIKLTDVYGTGPTDEPTLKAAKAASAQTSHEVIETLTAASLQCALTNAVRASEIGVIKGKDQGYSGKVDKIDTAMLHSLIAEDIVPIINPIIFDRSGQSLRVNSDHLAAELAIQLKATKLIYLTPFPGLSVNDEAIRNIPLNQLQKLISSKKSKINERLLSKSKCAIHTLKHGPSRAHILDGRIFGCLLTEIFDKVGLGTMIHANDYQRIRSAKKKDAQTIFNIAKHNIKTEALHRRTKQSIEKDIKHFFVYEIDESIIGCACLKPYGKSKTTEISCVNVQSFYSNKGVGKELIEYACAKAKSKGFKKVVALSTQASSFFKKICDFKEGSEKDLSAERRKEYQANKRNSKILVKSL